METQFCYRVQQYERKNWKTKSETRDLRLAFDIAHQMAITSKERVRVIRIEESELITFHIY